MGHWASPDQVWAGALVFARVGAVLMLLPGVGEASVSIRVRLTFALLLAMALTPIVQSTLPTLPDTVGAMGGWVLREATVGLMLGALLRTLMSALNVAGEIVSIQTSLSFAQTANPDAPPEMSLASFLTVTGLTLVFATNLHHLFIGAIANSYQLFAPHKHLLVGDAGQLAIKLTSEAFMVGVQLAAPVLVFSLVFNAATGLIGRVMPQFQVFFAATPLNVLMGLSVFALSLGTLGLVWVSRYRDLAGLFLG
ncbi:MAG TPA: flagellar biosynthetic protein FliR [Caulobacteraceae bacterium]|jgi:flagellar biosynthetic protein FliR|nr:flagellar biosynthetic protein FliR [Caulobacteraceae bacterium]